MGYSGWNEDCLARTDLLYLIVNSDMQRSLGPRKMLIESLVIVKRRTRLIGLENKLAGYPLDFDASHFLMDSLSPARKYISHSRVAGWVRGRLREDRTVQ